MSEFWDLLVMTKQCAHIGQHTQRGSGIVLTHAPKHVQGAMQRHANSSVVASSLFAFILSTSGTLALALGGDAGDPLREWISSFQFTVPPVSIPFDIPFFGERNLSITNLVGCQFGGVIVPITSVTSLKTDPAANKCDVRDM